MYALEGGCLPFSSLMVLVSNTELKLKSKQHSRSTTLSSLPFHQAHHNTCSQVTPLSDHRFEGGLPGTQGWAECFSMIVPVNRHVTFQRSAHLLGEETETE